MNDSNKNPETKVEPKDASLFVFTNFTTGFQFIFRGRLDDKLYRTESVDDVKAFYESSKKYFFSNRVISLN